MSWFVVHRAGAALDDGDDDEMSRRASVAEALAAADERAALLTSEVHAVTNVQRATAANNTRPNTPHPYPDLDTDGNDAGSCAVTLTVGRAGMRGEAIPCVLESESREGREAEQVRPTGPPVTSTSELVVALRPVQLRAARCPRRASPRRGRE